MNPKAEELKALQFAMEEDFQQHIINNLTPDRSYPFPMDNVLAWLSRHTPEHEERDSQRIDFLERHVVEVRIPLAHGSKHLFWASPSEEDEPSKIRAKIDAAMSQPAK